jgi:hypothetical protein
MKRKAYVAKRQLLRDGKLLLQSNEKAAMMFANDLVANHKADDNYKANTVNRSFTL